MTAVRLARRPLRRLRLLLIGAVLAGLAALAAYPMYGSAAEAGQPGTFDLQVTPSPLVTTVKPGTTAELELKIRNNGTAAEHLKIEPRSFSLDSDSTNINLLDTEPPEIADWIRFSRPQFTVQPGQWTTQQITVDVPENTGFSYSFVLVVSRQEDPELVGSGRLLKGSVAVFTLINVDRPGAKSSLEVEGFTADKRVYEYLPATFSIRLRNTGNTIVQPYGNIFIARDGDSGEPLGSLVVNDAKGHILPDTTRTITASWTDGFPAYQTVQNPDGTTSRKLVWDWTKVSSLRIGRYTTKLVVVYNQGGRDVPIEGTVSFWVIPWKILGVLLLILLLVLFALFMLGRMIYKAVKRGRAKRAAKKSAPPANPPKEKTE